MLGVRKGRRDGFAQAVASGGVLDLAAGALPRPVLEVPEEPDLETGVGHGG